MAADLISLLLATNLAGGAAVAMVILLRPAVRHLFGARLAYGLWFIPLAAAAAVLLPARAQTGLLSAVLPEPLLPLPAVDATVGVTSQPAAAAHADVLLRLPADPSVFVCAVWLIGVLICIGLTWRRQRALVAKLGVLEREDAPGGLVYRARAPAAGPAVVGVMAPKVVVPHDFEARFSPEERVMIMAHERRHLAAGHALINGLAAGLRCLNWFNPLVHLAVIQQKIDQELACDAAVVARFPDRRQVYGEAMLKTQLMPATYPLACQWPAPSKSRLRQRVEGLALDPPRRRRVVAGATALVLLAAGAGLIAWSMQPARATALWPAPAYGPTRPEVATAIAAGDARRVLDLGGSAPETLAAYRVLSRLQPGLMIGPEDHAVGLKDWIKHVTPQMAARGLFTRIDGQNTIVVPNVHNEGAYNSFLSGPGLNDPGRAVPVNPGLTKSVDQIMAEAADWRLAHMPRTIKKAIAQGDIFAVGMLHGSWADYVDAGVTLERLAGQRGGMTLLRDARRNPAFHAPPTAPRPRLFRSAADFNSSLAEVEAEAVNRIQAYEARVGIPPAKSALKRNALQPRPMPSPFETYDTVFVTRLKRPRPAA